VLLDFKPSYIPIYKLMLLVIKRQVAGKEDRTECNTTLIFETVDRIASFFSALPE
jgi:hypothetical protein